MTLLPLLLVVVLAVALASGVAFVRRSPASRETTVAAARRHAAATSVAALALASTAGLATMLAGWRLVSGAGHYGVAALLLPLAFGVTHTLVVLLGELTWPRPEGDVRRARLVRRGPWDAAPRWLVRLTAGTGVLAVLTLAIGAALADADGRSITVADGRFVTHRSSPFPGWFYGRPAAVGLLVLAAATLAALLAVANRAAVVTADDRMEAALRRGSAHRVLRGATGTALVTTGGLLLTGGHAVAVVADGLPALVGWAVAVLGGACALGGVVLACLRAPRLPADELAPAR